VRTRGAREWRAISKVTGVPLADDLDKGVYFLTKSGEILLASPTVPDGKRLVAGSVGAFRIFTPRGMSGSDA